MLSSEVMEFEHLALINHWLKLKYLSLTLSFEYFLLIENLIIFIEKENLITSKKNYFNDLNIFSNLLMIISIDILSFGF